MAISTGGETAPSSTGVSSQLEPSDAVTFLLQLSPLFLSAIVVFPSTFADDHQHSAAELNNEERKALLTVASSAAPTVPPTFKSFEQGLRKDRLADFEEEGRRRKNETRYLNGCHPKTTKARSLLSFLSSSFSRRRCIFAWWALLHCNLGVFVGSSIESRGAYR